MAEKLWEPSVQRVAQTNLSRFIEFINQKHGTDFKDYPSLYDWSVENIAAFQEAVWHFFNVMHTQPYTEAVTGLDKMPGAKWFPGAKLNFAENLLRHRDDHPAIVFRSENGSQRSLTYAELYGQVARLAAALAEFGVAPGDRVAGFMPNIPETIVAMLASVSLGAVWSSCSPDFGFQGVMDRFGQIQPKVLFCADGYFYGGKTFSSLERVAKVKAEIPGIEQVVVVPFTSEEPAMSLVPGAHRFDELVSGSGDPGLNCAQLPFDHPLYILYSSGTTGVPKCMVHGAGNVLLQHLKELGLQSDLKREDKIFYFTTCGWMMWNWLVSSLALGATLLLFDGSPFYPGPEVLWKFADDEGMTIFGTSARYLAAIENEGLKPGKQYDLSALKAVLSTGSPLSIESFKYVYRDIKSDVCLSSISGGSDLVGCFALGNPIGPVYAGQLQARGLGMAVEAWNDEGKPVVGEKAELVCTKPWPSMPIGFWNDPDGAKYRAAYFEVYPNIWFHGDFCEVTPEGGVIMYGRSDATLNPGGVRIGTAEIYRQVENMPEIADSLVVGQDWAGDVRVLLFVRLNPGYELDDELTKKIKTLIRTSCTPRHVPAKILAVEDIPYTISGKKVELAVRNVVHGREVKNKDALANPQALELYDDLEELKK
ncbi:MAG: acetoacetate--CoA ligase [Proteobacteria bacterium]|nr:acetoacetate--CoA ligase [Pseudomonadota bacterium]MBU4278779.1 acetoacetate--CoA ligase [Pseudomonadota bacterium]MBU4385004.1 acetoacetate--CoA ligase [Pseudomonadota bacterium]MBU4604788.1 acetoacetate--CoA ligase [Pseudomonadota bacterium]MCG2763128.1 acetoacetate--CoA ligase [Desulfarculaceae bacterium]